MNLRILILDCIRNLNQKKVFDKLIESQFSLTKEQISDNQNRKFEELFTFHYRNNEEYKKLIEGKGYIKRDSFDINDIPIINKDDIRGSKNLILSKFVHTLKHSGGSTGKPLSYGISKESLSHLWPDLWRAFSVYGVRPNEKIAMIAGPSLYNNRSFKRITYDLISNFKVISAFDLNNEKLKKAYELISKNKIKAIYGYTSSVLIFLRYLENNNLYLELKGIFTTSETFIPIIRELALKFCNCDVIDIYGANDGGIQSFECQCHTGYHIGIERCKIELIDRKIITTDLLNTATPFIRYEVGDLCINDKLITERCKCGRTLFRLKGISGRINSFIEDIDGNRIHTEFFSHMFYGATNVEQYQVKNYGREAVLNILGNPSLEDQKRYDELLKRRFQMKISIEINKQILKLPNSKVPILINI